MMISPRFGEFLDIAVACDMSSFMQECVTQAGRRRSENIALANEGNFASKISIRSFRIAIPECEKSSFRDRHDRPASRKNARVNLIQSNTGGRLRMDRQAGEQQKNQGEFSHGAILT